MRNEILIVVFVLALDENKTEVCDIVGSHSAYLIPAVVEVLDGIVDVGARVQAIEGNGIVGPIAERIVLVYEHGKPFVLYMVDVALVHPDTIVLHKTLARLHIGAHLGDDFVDGELLVYQDLLHTLLIHLLGAEAKPIGIERIRSCEEQHRIDQKLYF